MNLGNEILTIELYQNAKHISSDQYIQLESNMKITDNFKISF